MRCEVQWIVSRKNKHNLIIIGGDLYPLPVLGFGVFVNK